MGCEQGVALILHLATWARVPRRAACRTGPNVPRARGQALLPGTWPTGPAVHAPAVLFLVLAGLLQLPPGHALWVHLAGALAGREQLGAAVHLLLQADPALLVLAVNLRAPCSVVGTGGRERGRALHHAQQRWQAAGQQPPGVPVQRRSSRIPSDPELCHASRSQIPGDARGRAAGCHPAQRAKNDT